MKELYPSAAKFCTTSSDLETSVAEQFEKDMLDLGKKVESGEIKLDSESSANLKKVDLIISTFKSL